MSYSEDREFEAVPTAMHRPMGGSGLADFVPAWQPSDLAPLEEEDKRTAFFSREEVLRTSRLAKPAPLTPPTSPPVLSRPPRPEPEEELPTVIVDSLSSLPAPTPARRAETRSARRHGAALVGVLCGVVGIGVGVSAAFAIERGPMADGPVSSAPVSSASVSSEPVSSVAEPVSPPVPSPAEEVPAPAAPPVAEAAPPVVDVPEEVPDPEALLREARSAIESADVELAQSVIDAAREAEANPVVRRRLEAQLCVLRGDGALSVPRLAELSERHDDAVLHVAYGRLLVQAERDEQAMRAFRRALAADPHAVDAHLGLAGIRARAFSMPAARRHLGDAREALAAQPGDSARLRARVRVMEGTIALESGSRGRAEEAAQDALDIDPRSAEAHFLLARMSEDREATRHLRFAVAGRAPAPVSTGMLASHVRGDEACELAARYLDRAPRGFDAPSLRRVHRRCGG